MAKASRQAAFDREFRGHIERFTQPLVSALRKIVTAASGSVPTVIAAPELLIQSSNGFFGASSAGVATRKLKSKRCAACIHDVSTLVASPVQATVRPRIGPRHSSKVMTSAST